MAFEIASPTRFILACSVFSTLAGFVRTCNDNEYLHVESGQCFECTKCADKELVRWVPCRRNADTVCAMTWQPGKARESITQEHSGVHAQNNGESITREHSGVHAQNNGVGNRIDAERRQQWRVIEYITGSMVILVGLVAIVLTIIYMTRIRRRRQRHIYRIILRDEVKSIQQLAAGRTFDVGNNNVYVRTDDYLKESHYSELV